MLTEIMNEWQLFQLSMLCPDDYILGECSKYHDTVDTKKNLYNFAQARIQNSQGGGGCTQELFSIRSRFAKIGVGLYWMLCVTIFTQ